MNKPKYKIGDIVVAQVQDYPYQGVNILQLTIATAIHRGGWIYVSETDSHILRYRELDILYKL